MARKLIPVHDGVYGWACWPSSIIASFGHPAAMPGQARLLLAGPPPEANVTRHARQAVANGWEGLRLSGQWHAEEQDNGNQEYHNWQTSAHRVLLNRG